jgi:hypothetical protein
MARYTYDPSPIIDLAQAILSYANGILWRASIAGGAAGIIAAIVIWSSARPYDWRSEIVLVAAASAAIGAFIFRSVAIGRVLVLCASAQMLLLMVKVEENTRPK